MNNKISQITSLLHNAATVSHKKQSSFFKTGAGNYAEHDQFLGVPVPTIQTIAKKYSDISLEEISTLLASPFNEMRRLALIILAQQYPKANNVHKDEIYQFYMNNLQHVNNWNLVDASAHLIVGAHLLDKNKDILLTLAQSKNLWERRIAMVATLYFIRKNQFEWTFTIATLLLNDTHDLIHKAVGWMLRETGKKETQPLINFLEKHAAQMPRTMLRYAIEKFPEEQRKLYLNIRSQKIGK